MLWPDFAHRPEDFERESKAVFKTPSILICTTIVQWSEKHRKQVAVSTVQFNPVETSLLAHFGRTYESITDLVHVLSVHLSGNLIDR